MLISQRHFLIMICFCDIIVICVKECRAHIKINAQTDFQHTMHIPKGNVVYARLSKDTITRYFVYLAQPEPIHVSISSCGDSEIDVVVSHSDQLTSERTALTTMSGRSSLTFEKQLAARGLYTFEILVQNSLGSRVRFQRNCGGRSFRESPRRPHAKVAGSQRRAFTVRWPRSSTVDATPVAYCLYVTRVPHSVRAHCTAEPSDYGVPDVDQKLADHCGRSNSFTYTSALPGKTYNVDIFAVNTENGETYAYPTLKVNTKLRTSEFELNTRRPHRVLVARGHNERYMAFPQVRFRAARLQLVATVMGGATRPRPVTLTLYHRDRAIAVSPPQDPRGVLTLTATIPRGRFVLRANSTGGVPYTLDLAMSVSDASSTRARRPPHFPVVDVPRNARLVYSGGFVRWRAAHAKHSRPQRYCLYHFPESTTGSLRRRELIGDLRRIGQRLYCTGESSPADREISWKVDGRGYSGRNVFIVYVVSSNKRILQRRFDMLQVDM